MSLALKDVVLRVEGQTHIHPTSLELAPRGFNILLGTTLAGKTTLMRLMAGLLKPTSGEIWFDGKNVTGVPVRERRVAMVYQQFINYPHLTVFDNIASPLRVAGVSSAQVKERVGRIAELLRLSPLLDRRPAELSGGQQQRTALARALVKDADLVLLDEPLANLDYKLREGLRDELPRLFADRDCTVVYATTEPAETLLLGGHTATLHEGAITQFGPTEDVYRRPVDLTTAQVFSDPPINTAPVVKRGSRIEISDVVGLERARRTGGAGRRRVHARAAATSCAAGRARRANGCEGRRGRRPDSRRTGQRASVGRRDQRVRERRALRSARARMGVAVARRAPIRRRRDGRLQARRRARPVLRCPRPLCQRGRPRDGAGVAMARIGLKNVRHSYREHPAE